MTAARACAIALGAVVVAGCGGGPGAVREAPREVAVTADRIVIAGPEGFCVDPGATRDGGDTAFVLLGNCAAIANTRRAGQPAVPALLTAAVSGSGPGGDILSNIGALDGFFRSDEGRRLLSRTQEAGTVEILETDIVGDVFYLHARDSSSGPVEGVQRAYWRAYLDLGPRIATLSVLGLQDRALSEAQSRAALAQFLAAVRGANSGAPDAAGPGPTVEPEGAPGGDAPIWDLGVFRRIFG